VIERAEAGKEPLQLRLVGDIDAFAAGGIAEPNAILLIFTGVPYRIRTGVAAVSILGKIRSRSIVHDGHGLKRQEEPSATPAMPFRGCHMVAA
jgi:hypothetical protein